MIRKLTDASGKLSRESSTKKIDVEKLGQVKTWPLKCERNGEITSAYLEDAWIFPDGFFNRESKRRLTESEREWIDENRGEWVVEMCNEEHGPDEVERDEVPSCEYYGMNLL